VPQTVPGRCGFPPTRAVARAPPHRRNCRHPLSVDRRVNPDPHRPPRGREEEPRCETARRRGGSHPADRRLGGYPDPRRRNPAGRATG
jgi:hypothetical protein